MMLLGEPLIALVLGPATLWQKINDLVQSEAGPKSENSKENGG